MPEGFPVTAADRETYQRDGVVCLRRLIPADWIARLREAVEAVMNAPSEFSRDLAREAGATGAFYGELGVSLRDPVLRRFVADSPIARAAAEIMGSRSARYFSDQLLVKEPGTSAETLWHQDFPYFPCDGDKIGSVWLGLDPVSAETGAMSFVVGSHRTGRLYTPRNFGSGGAYDTDEFDGPAPDVFADPDRYETVCYEMEPGDVTFHHARTLHGARGNGSPTVRRRALTVRMAGDDVVWRNRKYLPRGFEALADGAPLDGPRYPVLWAEARETAAP
jgi:ectoine hydroxylase-related dioxygenase (phytanoyl-CoA dioxygenase family)